MISTNCSLQDWRHKKPTEMDCADGGENYEIPEKGEKGGVIMKLVTFNIR